MEEQHLKAVHRHFSLVTHKLETKKQCRSRECINSGLDYRNGGTVEWWTGGFLEIDPVQIIGMCVRVCVCVRARGYN